MIKLFVFDLGGVILPFEHRQIATKLHAKSRTKEAFSPDEIFSYMFDMGNGFVDPYEEGLMSSLQFFTTVKERYKLGMEYEEFIDIWNQIFWENTGVCEVIQYLKKKRFPLFLLSNTNELHFSYIIEHYPIVHAMDEWILSFEVGAKKPDKRIYDVIFEKTDVDRREVLYIDDIPNYVDAARGFGMNGLVFRSPEQLWQVLKENCI